MKFSLLFLFFFPILVFSQSKKQKKLLAAQQKENQQLINNIKGHIERMQTYQSDPLLPNDSVIAYLENQLKEIGILPGDSDGFVQNIIIDEGKEIDSSTFLKVNGKELQLNEDYFPFPFSLNKTINGMPAMALREKNQPWFIEINTLSNPKNKPDNNIWDNIEKEATRAAGKGATALFVFNSTAETSFHFNAKDSNPIAPIPVVYITYQGLKKYFPDQADIVEIEMNVLLKPKRYETKNIIGIIDNGAANTILVKSFLPNALERNINDTLTNNFCEPAVMIELAKLLKAPKFKNNNFLFSINGAKENYSLTRPINYTLLLSNLRFSTNATSLYLYGFETTPTWKELLPTIDHGKLQINFDSIGSQLNSIIPKCVDANPYVIFSTNEYSLTNQNFEPDVDAIKYILRIIEKTESAGQLVYNKKLPEAEVTKRDTLLHTTPNSSIEKNTITPKKQTVSFGIVIDKTYTGQGLKIRSLIPKRLGIKLGLHDGDIITSLGEYPISNYKSYFEALSKFNPGDNTILGMIRNNEAKEINVTF